MTSFNLKSRPAKIQHRAIAASRKKTEMIKDIAVVMGSELNILQLASDLKVPVAKVFLDTRDIV
jgi:hypothetical protein